MILVLKIIIVLVLVTKISLGRSLDKEQSIRFWEHSDLDPGMLFFLHLFSIFETLLLC